MPRKERGDRICLTAVWTHGGLTTYRLGFAHCKEASRWMGSGLPVQTIGISAKSPRPRRSSITAQTMVKPRGRCQRGCWKIRRGNVAHPNQQPRRPPKLLIQIPLSGRNRCPPLQDCDAAASLTSTPASYKRQSICRSTPISTLMFRVALVSSCTPNDGIVLPRQRQLQSRYLQFPTYLRFPHKRFHSKPLWFMDRQEYMPTATRVGRIGASRSFPRERWVHDRSSAIYQQMTVKAVL